MGLLKDLKPWKVPHENKKSEVVGIFKLQGIASASSNFAPSSKFGPLHAWKRIQVEIFDLVHMS